MDLCLSIYCTINFFYMRRRVFRGVGRAGARWGMRAGSAADVDMWCDVRGWRYALFAVFAARRAR